MSETLHIKNFGPIEDVKLDLKRVTVLIGENATGKSTIAKLLAVCRYFSFIIDHTLHQKFFEKGLEAWGLSECIKHDTYIHYECEHYDFLAIRKVEKSNIENPSESLFEMHHFSTVLSPLSTEFKNLIQEFEKIKSNSNNNEANQSFIIIPTSFFQNEVANVLDNPFYLPTERGLQSIFSLGKNSIPNISDSLFNQFANLDLIAKNFKAEVRIEPLKISYKNINGTGFVKKENENHFYSLANGASGYQSATPIILAMKYYSDIRNKKKPLFIEEPELNLFPNTQKELINYLVVEGVNKGGQILLTTHSPYILTSLSNLMYAYKTGIVNDKVATVIPKKYWLNPDHISCYLIKSDGKYESIIDEDGLIKAEKIDEVSDIINTEYAQIGEIIYGGND